MRTVPKWVNKIHEADKVKFSSVYAICFSPDGTQLVVGAGEKVMVYDPRDGALVQLLQAHKGAVTSVAYCGDGKKFASGSSDKNVIIWTSKMEGVLKYSHSEAIQCLAYNPVTLILVSCSMSDFAFWSEDVKAVQKYRVSGRITSCAWAENGQHLAVGLAAGAVSIRDKQGDEIHRIARNSAVWAVAFSKSTLLVADWNDTLSFYNLQGQVAHKEKNIGITPLSMSLLGALVLVGGVGGWAVLTLEGVPLLTTHQEWIWAITPSPSLNTMAVACQDGTLWCYQVVFTTVHGLYRERYAYRENMTDVIIQHLSTGSKVRIKCHDRVLKVAIYKHRLAVQLPERVVVYEQADSEGMLYRVKLKLTQRTECSLLVTTSNALLVCQIWLVDPRSGDYTMILLTPASVRCFDVSPSRGRLAVVDELSVCRIYSLPAGDLLYSEENVSSVSWNAWCEELLSMSGGNLLSIKAGHFTAATHPLAGSVVGFQGGRVFCLQANAMQTINVPLSHAVHQYTQQKMFEEAYAVACLGVTASDWERLGFAALEELSFEVARMAFQRSYNFIFAMLIDNLQERFEAGEKRGVIIGDVLAYRGRYGEAARAYRAAGVNERALTLYIDLRMFNKAQDYISESEGESLQALARRRAEWARYVNEPRAAAEMYLAVGDVRRATELMASCGRRDMLIELARKLDRGSSESLRYVAEALVATGEFATAADVYQRLGMYKQVAQLAVQAGEWSRAFQLAREHAECRRDVYLPYAHIKARESKFIDAQNAYYMAGEMETAMRVFKVLVNNAVSEERFSDAGYLHYLLACQCRDSAVAATSHKERELCSRQAEMNERLALVYHAYDGVHSSVHEPFSLSEDDALINTARYLLALLEDQPAPAERPPGVSMFCLYLCIAKQAKGLNANSLVRQMLDKILGFQIPQKFQETVELLIVKTRGGSKGGETRDDDLAALCWRCRRHVPPLCALRCPHCGHALVYSIATHEVLPLVELTPAEGISTEEALELIERTPIPESAREETGAEVLKIDHALDNADPFLEKAEDEEDGGVVVCSRGALLALPPASVVVVRSSPPRFYRNMLPELPVVACPYCHYLFYADEYEIQTVIKGICTFCRQPAVESWETASPPLDSSERSSPPSYNLWK